MAVPAGIKVTATRPNSAVYVAPTGTTDFSYAGNAGSAPLVVPVDVNGTYDVRVEAPADFFHVYRGEKQGVGARADVTVLLRRELLWPRVIISVAPLVLGVLFFLLTRVTRLKSTASTLEGQLADAESYASLKPGQLPRKIGPYKVLSRLGSGGMAVVFKVEDAYGDVYALKVPDPRILDDPELSARFFREMEIGRTLRHPGVVRIFDVHKGDADTHPYIAQEFVEGETLRAALNRQGALSEDRAREIARGLADILSYAHSQGIVHRDVKPSNVMLRPDGSLRLMDFGIAKAATLETMTGTDTTLGTPAYMAPEQVDSHEATVQSDVYALGVVLFEMLAGRLPFEEADPYRMLVRKIRERPPRVSSIQPRVSHRMDNLVALLLQADPGKRPDSAGTVARMLAMTEEEATG